MSRRSIETEFQFWSRMIGHYRWMFRRDGLHAWQHEADRALANAIGWASR